MRHNLHRITGLFLLAAATLCAGDRRVHLLPQLQPGQTITYLIRFQSDKNIKTESNVVASMIPDAAQLDAHGLLRVEVLDVQQTGSKTAIHLRGQFLPLDSGVRSEEHTSELQSRQYLVCRLLLEKKKNNASISVDSICTKHE